MKIIPLILISLFMFDTIIAQDWANLNRYKEANAVLAQSAPDEDRVVFMGNSITEGWSNLCPEFFENSSHINRGIGGQTTPQMLVRFRADVVALNPAAVVILAGTNDIAGNTGPSTIEMIADNIKSMAEVAKANDIKVVLSSVLPAYDYPWKPGLKPAEKIVALNEILKAYANKNDHVYLDYFSEMADDRNGMIEKYTSDGVHVTEKGYKLMSGLAKKAIKQALSQN